MTDIETTVLFVITCLMLVFIACSSNEMLVGYIIGSFGNDEDDINYTGYGYS